MLGWCVLWLVEVLGAYAVVVMLVSVLGLVLAWWAVCLCFGACLLVVVVWSASWAGSVLRPFFVARAILSQRAITRNTQ